MIRTTSIEAYNALIENGGLSRKRAQVYKYLYKNGSSTQTTVERYYEDRTVSIRPRFAELEKMGLIKVVGEIETSTGRSNTLWDVTDRVNPLPIANTVTKKHRVEAALQALRNLFDHKDDAPNEEWTGVADLIKNI